jgi:hypothetical protein
MQTHARMFGVEAILIVPLGIAGARLPYAVSSQLGRPGSARARSRWRPSCTSAQAVDRSCHSRLMFRTRDNRASPALAQAVDRGGRAVARTAAAIRGTRVPCRPGRPPPGRLGAQGLPGQIVHQRCFCGCPPRCNANTPLPRATGGQQPVERVALAASCVQRDGRTEVSRVRATLVRLPNDDNRAVHSVPQLV